MANARVQLSKSVWNINNLLPDQTGHGGEFLTSDGTNISWAAAGGGAGTVTSVSVVNANGFDGTVANPATTPAITIKTTVTGITKGNGTALSAATAGTDYSDGTAALATGILKSTTGTGALTIAIAGDFPTLNQNTTGTAALATAIAGGAANQIPYQTAPGVTSFFSAANYGVATYSATGVPTAIPGVAGVLQGSASIIPTSTVNSSRSTLPVTPSVGQLLSVPTVMMLSPPFMLYLVQINFVYLGNCC